MVTARAGNSARGSPEWQEPQPLSQSRKLGVGFEPRHWARLPLSTAEMCSEANSKVSGSSCPSACPARLLSASVQRCCSGGRNHMGMLSPLVHGARWHSAGCAVVSLGPCCPLAQCWVCCCCPQSVVPAGIALGALPVVPAGTALAQCASCENVCYCDAVCFRYHFFSVKGLFYLRGRVTERPPPSSLVPSGCNARPRLGAASRSPMWAVFPCLYHAVRIMVA